MKNDGAGVAHDLPAETAIPQRCRPRMLTVDKAQLRRPFDV